MKVLPRKMMVEERERAEVIGLDRRQLLSRHVAGDTEAFPELVSLYRSQVFSYLVRCGVQAMTRDDLFQEIFLKIHSASRSYDPRRPLSPWIFTIVANTVRSHYRRERVRGPVLGAKSTHEVSPADTHGELEGNETAEWLMCTLQKLPFHQREVVVLHCIRELEQRDVATILGRPVNTVKTDLRRARQSLAKALAARKEKILEEVMS